MKKMLYTAALIVSLTACQKNYYLDELTEAEAEIERLEREAANQANTINNQTNVIASLQQTIIQLNSNITEIETLLAEVNGENEQLQLNIVGLQTLIDERDALIVQLQGTSSSDTEEIVRLTAQINALNAQVATLQNQVTETVKELETAQNAEPVVIEVEVTEVVTVVQVETQVVTEVIVDTQVVTQTITEYVNVPVETIVVKTCDFSTTDTVGTPVVSVVNGTWSSWSPASGASDVATLTQTRTRVVSTTTSTDTTRSYTLLSTDASCSNRADEITTESNTVAVTETETRQIANPDYVAPSCETFTTAVNGAYFINYTYANCNSLTYSHFVINTSGWSATSTGATAQVQHSLYANGDTATYTVYDSSLNVLETGTLTLTK